MNRQRILVLATVGLLAALLTHACGDGVTEPPPPPPDAPRPTTVTLGPATAELTALGATVRLDANVRDQNGRAMAGTVTWVSANPSVASVNESGLVTAVGNGTAAVTATAGSASGTATVTVAQRVNTVAVSPVAGARVLLTGDTLRLAAEVADANGHAVEEARVTWSSGDPSVATVDTAGLVTGVETGEVEITATSSDVTGLAALTVATPAPTVIAVTPDTVVFTALGGTTQLAAEVRDQSGRVMKGRIVAWSSADTLVVSVDSAGLVTAAGAGVTTVVARAGEASGETVVSVMQAAGSVVVSPSMDTIGPGDTLRLVAEAIDANGHRVGEAAFDWSSSDPSVASVSAAGLVTGVGEGTATIAAMIGNARGISEITVVNPDGAALVALYNATDGPNWVNNDNWLTDAPLGEWYGVETDASGRVVSVNLSAKYDSDAGEIVRHGLSGSIPPELGNLANLTELNLGWNELTGPIPPELGNLANLARLSLRINALTGPIPSELGNLSNVTRLDLGSNELTGLIPPELGNLSNLTRLDLGSNELTGPIPPELGNLVNLKSVRFRGNALTGPISPELGNLANLTSLDLGGHTLTGPIPPELGNLANLTSLSLNGNALTGPIPPELGNLANLTWLHLGGNELTGPIPPELGNLANLTLLSLNGNEVTGPIPPELGSLANLTSLHLGGNALTGPIPPELGSLANLTRLSLYENALTGPIPPELGNLANLTWLSLFANALSGPIPPELGNLANLEVLALRGNELTGRIPPELGRLANLESLGLGSASPQFPEPNELTGPIPPELGRLSNLERLYLFDNDLSGPLPPELSELGSLTVLLTGGNDICVPGVGRFVRWIDGMRSFDGSYCNESDAAVLESLHESAGGGGWINSSGWRGSPALDEWHGVGTDVLGRVATLDLAANGLAGELPSNVGQLAELTELRIGDNSALAGRLPISLTRLSLSVLHYAGTDLCSPADDTFRAWLGGVTSHEGTGAECVLLSDRDVLAYLYRTTDGPNWVSSDNWLTDAPLGEWYGVKTDASGRVVSVDLLENELTGPIPTELGRLANLTELNLFRNELTGSIPPELGNLTNLMWLDLRQNELTGPIPPELSNLANLTDLSLGGNALTGPIPPALGNLANLTRLILRWNELTGPIPPELGRLANLMELNLVVNELTGPIPPALGNLANLTRLNFYGNELTGPIPPELGRLANLTELNLGWNALTGPIPPELGRLANLTELNLGVTELTGPIPSELGSLANLTRLDLSWTELTGPIPPELGNLANLTKLYLRANALTGPIPPELGNLANLTDLYLYFNALTGPIPPELGRLANLTSLSLVENALTGPIPPELGRLARLETLRLRDNDLSGSLSPEFGRLARLEELDLTHNAAISGVLPASLTNLRNLEGLYARGTGLCAPNDDTALRAWIDGVPEAHVATCAPAAAYLVQAVQSREFPVPLVAGEEALLRVFVTAERGAEVRIPPVRARFYLAGSEVYVTDIPAGSSPVPAEVDESSLSNSANAVIPPEVVRPGLEMVMEIDPDGTLDPGLGVAERIPTTGRLAVAVREMSRFDLTVIPFLWVFEPDSSVIEFAQGMAADPEGHELLAATRTLLPVADLTVTAHSPVTSSSNSGFAVLRETAAIRAIEGGGSHHMGLIAYFSDVGGTAVVGDRVSASRPNQRAIAHELGHNMRLSHAPCGGARGPDPRFPYPDGSIGAWGYDFPGEYDVRPGGGLVSPSTDDLMGYCGPDWISDYHFTRALDFRLADEGAPVAAAERSILVWGGVDEDGAAFLDPAFVVDAAPALPDPGGEYEVVGRTVDGGEMFSLGFAMPETADANSASAFVFVVPAEPGWADALASLTLSGPAGEATLDRSTNRPMAILRDPVSGQVRGFLRDLPPATLTRADAVAAVSPEPGLDVLFSRGIPDATGWRE